MKDELRIKIKTKFLGVIAKTYSYLIDEDSEDKKAKCPKKRVARRKSKWKTQCFY